MFVALGSATRSTPMDWLAYFHHWLAAVGAFFLLRTMGTRPEAAAVGGIVFGLSGFTVVSAGFWLGMQSVLAWAPFVAAATLRACRPGGFGRWGAIGAGCYAASICAGFAEYAAYVGLLAGMIAIAESLGGRYGRVRPLLAVAIIGLGGIALAGPQFIPTLEAAANSTRPAVLPASWVGLGSMAPADYLGFFEPLVATGAPVRALLYVSPLAVAFALMALARAVSGQRDTASRYAIAVFVFALLLSLGPSLPFGPLASHIPGLSAFRGAFKHIFELVFAISLLAGLGADQFLRESGRFRTLMTSLLLGTAAVLLVTGQIQPKIPLPRASVIAFFGVGVCALLVQRASPRAAVLVAAGFIALNLAQSRSAWLDDQRELRGSRDYANDAAWTQRDGPARILAVLHPYQPIEPESLFGDISVLQRLPAVNGAGPFLWKPLADALSMEEPGYLPLGDVFARRDQTLDVLGVRYVLFPRPTDGQGMPRADLVDRVARRGIERRGDGGRWIERATAAPFVRIADEVVCTQSGKQRLHDRRYDLARVALLTCDASGEDARVKSAAGTAELVELEPGTITVETRVEPGAKGLLVIAQADYPGWSARVDGEATRVERANALVQAVWVPPGPHRVVLSYDPASFRWGAGASALAVLLLGALWFWDSKRSRAS